MRREFQLWLVVVFLFQSVSFANAESPFHKLKEGIHKFTLDNGLRVIVYPRKRAPVFSAQIWVRVGGVDELPGTSGVSHMLEHMAFKGTETIGTKDFEKEKVLLEREEVLMNKASLTDEDKEELKKIGEELEKVWVDNEYSTIYEQHGEQGLNAGTSKDYTFYMVSLPTNAFELWCWMESEKLLRPVFRQFYKERDVVMEERRSRVDDNPDGKLYEALIATSYMMHPYRLPTIGWATDIQNLQPEDLRNLYKTYYRPDNMVVVLVGDLDPAVVKAKMSQYFERLPRGEGSLPKIRTVEAPQKGERQVTVEVDASPLLMMSYHKPANPHPDDAKFAVLHEWLAGGRSSILYKELVLKEQLVTDIYTTEAPGELFPPVFMVGATPNKGVKPEVVRDKIQSIFTRLETQKISKEEIESIKHRIKVSFVQSLESNYGLARLLANAELLWGDWEMVLKVYEGMMSTTNDDVSRLVSTYLKQEQRTVAISTQAKK